MRRMLERGNQLPSLQRITASLDQPRDRCLGQIFPFRIFANTLGDFRLDGDVARALLGDRLVFRGSYSREHAEFSVEV